jgi:tetratricopeptide (TPR) repeat protein
VRVLKDIRARQDAANKEIDSLSKSEDSEHYIAAVVRLSATEWFARGIKLLDERNFDKAAFAFDYSARRDHDNPNTPEMLGWAYYELGSYKHAIDRFDDALKIDPNIVKAYEGRALSYGDMGNPKRQLEDMKIAAKLGSKSAQKFLKAKNIDW